MPKPHHRLQRVDTEIDGDGQAKWRWVCHCSQARGHVVRRGQWTWQSEGAARTAWTRHAKAGV